MNKPQTQQQPQQAQIDPAAWLDQFEQTNIIHTYSREQAIEDGFYQWVKVEGGKLEAVSVN